MKIKVKPPLPKPAPEAQYKLTLSEAEFQIFLAYLKGTAGEPEQEPRRTVDAMLKSIYDSGAAKSYDPFLVDRAWIRERPIFLVKKGQPFYGS